MIKNPILTIAGFDNSGGAGLQADLKVFSAFGNYGMTVLTAIAVQNTTGVKNCYPIPLTAIEEQLESIFNDIPPKAIKIGMLFNEEIIDLVAYSINKYAPDTPIVLDPVMVAKSGDPLLLENAVDALKNKLLPLTSLVTPNLPEAFTLINKPISDTEYSIEEIAEQILALGCKAVLVKGGHDTKDICEDFLITKDRTKAYFQAPRIFTENTHGTGCTLSAAITSCMAYDLDLISSIKYGKYYLTEAIKSAAATSIGHGHGPTDHFWYANEPLFQNW